MNHFFCIAFLKLIDKSESLASSGIESDVLKI